MKCLWSAFYRNENFERIITSAWNWSHVQSHFVFISFLLYSLTRAVPDHVYSKQNLRLKEIKHQVWALMFHWFSQVHRSQICLSLFAQLVSYKVFLPIENFSPPSKSWEKGLSLLEHVDLGEGEVRWPGQAEQLLCEIAFLRLKAPLFLRSRCFPSYT